METILAQHTTTATLDTFGGLITFCALQGLPEGASPRNHDVDYGISSVFTRPGLESVYSYASTIVITGYSLGSGGLAQFTYQGASVTINEGFLLSNFVNALYILNGQTVYVESTGLGTFTAFVNGPIGVYSGLSGTGISTTGLFVGPNTGDIAIGPAWVNPSGISSPTGYASVSTGTPASAGPTAPTTVVESGTGAAWANPGNLVSPSSYATVTGNSQTLLAYGEGFNVPSNATITGITVALRANYSGASPNSITLQLATNGTPVGTPQTFAVGNTGATYTKGSSQFQWGTTFTPATVNGSVLGVLINTTGSGNFSADALVVTVYYTTSATSGALNNQGFSFAIALTNGISGFGVSFMAYSTPVSPASPTTLTLQLLQNGVPEGTPKTVTLTSTPTVYNIGGPDDPWGYLWSAADVNSQTFGVQITASGSGTTYVGDLDITPFITAALENFNWFGSYEQNNGALSTLALDAAGNIWIENVISNPGVLSLSLTGIIPGSYGNGATIDNNEFVMFSDLTIGTDRPRQLDANGNWYPVTQGGPGAAPTFTANTGFVGGIITLVSYTWAAPTPPATEGVATFTYVAGPTPPVAGAIVVLNVTNGAPALNGQAVIVLSGATTTTFSAEVTGTYPAGPTTIAGTASPTFDYAIASITQNPKYAFENPGGLTFLWSDGPGLTANGTTVTVYYNEYGHPADPVLTTLVNSDIAVYVQITGATFGSFDYNGIWLVTGLGQGVPPGYGETLCYFTFTYSLSGSNKPLSPLAGSSYQITLATVNVTTPVAGVTPGTSITITGATPTGWNSTWSVVTSNSELYTITSTGYDYTTNVATFGWGNNAIAPTPGDLITVIGATNNAAFNGTFVINTVAGATFTVAGINAPAGIPAGQTVETNAQATEFGTQFTFDPGANNVGTTTDVIFGNDTGTGDLFVIGSSIVPIGAGTRQAVCFFITESGAWTQASPPITFDVASNANLLNYSKLPIGPPNVIGRGIAITEAGQNGVPGANFYVITEPVSLTVNTVITTYTSTIINDNVTTSGSLSFTDAVLLNSEEIDVQGNDLFNLIEIGSCAWCVPYASRMFYGMQLNKINNWTTGGGLSFDGGYLPNPNGPISPVGWGIYPTVQPPGTSEISLVNSPVTGMALYIVNNTGAIQPVMGTVAQTAYQDPYNVAIIGPNTAYSIRVAAAVPSGIRLGTLVVSLVSLSNGVFGTTLFGSFSVPFTSMTSLVTVFTGTLLTTEFQTSVPPPLAIRVQVLNMGIGADVLIDRIEVFPTEFPYLKTEVYGSYVNEPEEVDASPEGGIIDTSTENAQTVFGGFVLRDSMYLLKSSSMYSTKDNPNAEPGGWSLTEVSNRTGACGINAYDVGEEWAVTACRNGIYGFTGTAPQLINLETLQIWNCINFNAGNSIVLRNDTENRRILCAVPLPTGTSPTGVKTATVTWLPFAPYNPAPTTPNVILMLNYQALASFDELMQAIGTHSTMFGSLANPDMRRKWTIWQIPTPFMGMVTRANLLDMPLYIGNGIDSSKIYQLNPEQLSDDGVAINSNYTCYGFVNAVKAATLPIFGLATKRYTVFQFNVAGAGNMDVTLYPNDLFARYPLTVPLGLPYGIALNSPENDDFYRPINIKGQRIFPSFSTNEVGSWFNLCKVLLSGRSDGWSSLPATGGGNVGITGTQQ